jgi:hypothetical protein
MLDKYVLGSFAFLVLIAVECAVARAAPAPELLDAVAGAALAGLWAMFNVAVLALALRARWRTGELARGFRQKQRPLPAAAQHPSPPAPRQPKQQQEREQDGRLLKDAAQQRSRQAGSVKVAPCLHAAHM